MYTIHLSAVLLLLVLAVQPSLSAPSRRILLMPAPYASHVPEMSAIGSELLTKGHDVHIMLPPSYPSLDRVKAESGFSVVEYSVAEPDFHSMPASEWTDVSMRKNPVDDMRLNAYKFMPFCTNPLRDPALADRLRLLQFDLALVDSFKDSRCYWILAHRLGIPYISLTILYEPWLWRVPAIPSFVPFPLGAGAYTERMTFLERLWNAWSLVDWTAWPRIDHIDNSFVEKYLPGQTYGTLAAKSLLWLVDTDAVLEYPRPVMPNEVRTSARLCNLSS